MKDRIYRLGTNCFSFLHPTKCSHFLLLLFLSLIVCCNPPPAIHVGKMSTEHNIINHQTLTPGFNGVSGTMTFHGITEEGKAALEDGFEIHCISQSCPVTFSPPYIFNDEPVHSEDDYLEPPLYSLTTNFEVPSEVTYPQVLELEFCEPTSGDPIGRSNYRLPITDAFQVKWYAWNSATESDKADLDFSPGAMAFMPELNLSKYHPEFPDNKIPEGRFGYLTLQSGGVAVWDTHTDTFQIPAYSDLAVVNQLSSTTSILFGAGSGNFEYEYSFLNNEEGDPDPQPGYPRKIVAGEFNRDGRIDLAIIYENLDKVHIFLGLGNGTFLDHANYEVDQTPRSIAIGDFDEDLLLDLVITNHDSQTLTLLYGSGDGNFGSECTISCTGKPTDVVVTKLNEGDELDLVVALYDSGKIVSYLGTGSRTNPFPDPPLPEYEYSCGDSPVSLAAGLFDDTYPDWTIDIAVANQLYFGKVSVLFGNGDGGFDGLDEIVLGQYPADVVAYTFGEDETVDLVVASEDNHKLYYLEGNGDGSFQNPETLVLKDSDENLLKPTAISVGHFNINDNNDLHPDLAVTAYDPTFKGYVLSVLGGSTGFDQYSTIIDHELGQYDTRPMDLVAIDFKKQFTDAYLLDRGRNCGYGALILPEPAVAYEGCVLPPCKAYLFVTNHTVDPLSLDIADIDCNGLTIGDGKYMADIVSVYEIDPNAFTPTANRPFNDKLVASVRVGCGPQGIAASPDGLYVYVCNAYEGSITVINFADCTDYCLLDLLPSIVDPSTPVSGSEYPNTIRKEELLDDPPDLGVEVINRSIATFQQIINAEETDYYAWVTMSGYETGDPNYPGSLILLDLSNPLDPQKSKTITGLGEFTIGVATMPEAFTFQTVVISDGHPESDPNGTPDRIAFIDSYDLINKCKGLDDNSVCYENYKKEKTLTDGVMSSSIAFRRDGHRAYVYRDASMVPGDKLSGLLVIDARPEVPVDDLSTEADEKVLGALNLKPSDSSPALELFWAEVKHEECVKYDEDENCILKSQPKLYLSAINDAEIIYDENLKGLWQRPEPLVIPGPPYSVEATSDDAPSSDAYNLERTFYIQDGGIVFNDELTHAAFSVETTPQKSDYPGDMDIIVKPLTCVDEGGDEIACDDQFSYKVKEINTEREFRVNITSENMGTDFSNMDAYPNWSPKRSDGYYFLYMSGMDTEPGGHADTDLFVINWDGETTTSNRINLMDEPNYDALDTTVDPDPDDPENPIVPVLDGDPHWYYNGVNYIVLYTRRLNRDGYYISELWKMELHPAFIPGSTVVEGSVQRLTNPCFRPSNDMQDPTYDPLWEGNHEHYYVANCSSTPPTPDPTEEPLPYGDFDPRISPLGGLIVFERQIGPDYPSDWDIIIVDIDFEINNPHYIDDDPPPESPTIWNITQHFDVSGEYIWSAEFIPYWKPGGIDETDLTYTVMAYRDDYIADDFYDQFRQRPTAGDPPGTEEREKRPLEDPGRSDNLIDGRGGWFPDADSGTANPEIVFFREIGSTTFVAEQAKRIPGR